MSDETDRLLSALDFFDAFTGKDTPEQDRVGPFTTVPLGAIEITPTRAKAEFSRRQNQSWVSHS